MSFRFHIISLIAVFLALALGIGMGVTVIDKATVDLLQQRLDSVRREVGEANQRSDELNRQQSRARDYEDQSEAHLVSGKLADVSVVIIGFEGVEQSHIDNLRKTLQTSGAQTSGVLWVTDKMQLSEVKNATELTQKMGLAGLNDSQLQQTQLKQAFVAALNAVSAGVSSTSSLSPLVEAGFLKWDGDKVKELRKVEFATSRIVVVSGYNAVIANDELAVPLVKMLAAQPQRRVVVAEAGKEADSRSGAQREVFVGPLRADSSLHDRISTVDNLETSPGRVAVTLSLADLPAQRTGDYGYSNGVDGLIPTVVS